jgi:uncharacterized membrane protein
VSKKRRDKQGQGPTENSGQAFLTSQQRQQIVQAQISASFSGPLPHPDILVRYNDAVPDAAERILAMAERQSAHRIDLEKRVITADIRRSNFGLAAGLIVALAFLVGSVVLVLSGYAVEGTIFATVDIAGLVATFVYGTERRRKEREDKARTLAGFDA